MKADVLGLDGKKIKNIDLPQQFNEDYNSDLINRAVLVINSNNRQPYGTMPLAGQGYSAKLSRRRRDYKGAYGKGISRVPRKTIWRRGMQFYWVGALAPGTVGGRRAHPPKATKIWKLKINDKERRKAIRSALSGVVSNSKILVLEKKFEDLKQTKDVKKVFSLLGLSIDSIKRRKAGTGKNRGRAVRYKKNPLVVVSGRCNAASSVRNLPGYDVVDVKSLNASVLTLHYGFPRPCIFTEGALELLDKEKLFLEKKK